MALTQLTVCLVLLFSQILAAVAVQSGYVSATATTAGGLASERLNSGKYLIASFPDLKQVAYCVLPDIVWRPLVIGATTSPRALAVDSGRNRLFVADSAESTVYWYNLYKRGNGLLFTTGRQNLALTGYDVSWMSVNGDGDLYFTGKEVVEAPQSSYDAVFRLDAASFVGGSSSGVPTELYTRSNSGAPVPAVWMPGGIAVDSFYVYWTNQEEGNAAGSVARGPRLNIGSTASLQSVSKINSATNESRGMALTDSNMFWLATDGVWAMAKNAETDSVASKIADPPTEDGTSNQVWDPRSIAYDGDGTMYLTDNLAGRIYTFSGRDAFPKTLTRFVDAPGVHGCGLLQIWNAASNDDLEASQSGASRQSALALGSLLALVFAVLAPMA